MSLNARAAADAPSSLLVYPIFDNTRGAVSLVTVTNTNALASIWVEHVYINSANCQETNLSRLLTPNDTLTVNTKTDNPNSQKGYIYVFAKSSIGGPAVKFDHLVGVQEVLDGAILDIFQVKPWNFKAGSALAEGANTDTSPADGHRDLDGTEYEQAPDHLVVPRFLGQGVTPGTTDLVLINLTGGQLFDTLVDFIPYNDQEDPFSAGYEFRCWVRVPLAVINGVFTNTFLQSTQSPTNTETVLGVYETGWYRFNGNIASSSSTSILNPALLALVLDRGVSGISSAYLPYGIGTQDNGKLLSHSTTGN
jgi:hypothetical protein